ncbi:MAG: hypothetical protein ACI965_000499 [Paraglaciecola sp.]|jgi:hypothetical protein
MNGGKFDGAQLRLDEIALLEQLGLAQGQN